MFPAEEKLGKPWDSACFWFSSKNLFAAQEHLVHQGNIPSYFHTFTCPLTLVHAPSKAALNTCIFCNLWIWECDHGSNEILTTSTLRMPNRNNGLRLNRDTFIHHVLLFFWSCLFCSVLLLMPRMHFFFKSTWSRHKSDSHGHNIPNWRNTFIQKSK